MEDSTAQHLTARPKKINKWISAGVGFLILFTVIGAVITNEIPKVDSVEEVKPLTEVKGIHVNERAILQQTEEPILEPTPSQSPTVKSTVKPTSKPTTSNVQKNNINSGITSSGGDKDCKDFGSQAEAQAYFNAKGGSSSNNVDNLDADHDGKVCESKK